MKEGLIVWKDHSWDQEIFRQIFHAYYEGVYFFALPLVGQSVIAEEITTDSFVKLWKLRHGFIHTGTVKAFLFVTTRNACYNYLRARKVHPEWTDNIPVDQYNGADESANERTEVETYVLGELYREIDQMKGYRKEIARLAFREGLSNSEIAEKLGLSPQAVRSARSRVVQYLRKFLAADHLVKNNFKIIR